MDRSENDHGLDSFIFYDTGFKNLSTVYFIVFQLLRIVM